MSDPVLNKLAKSREKLLAVVSKLTDAKLDDRPAEGWSIRENLTHLVITEEAHRSVIAAITQGELHRLPPSLDKDEYNASQLAKRGRLSLGDILSALADQRRRTEILFHSLSADQFTWRGHHPVLGDMAVLDIFRILAIHEQMHLREIEAILQESG
jgi:uncharacterized damage-inducible protein DinB